MSGSPTGSRIRLGRDMYAVVLAVVTRITVDSVCLVRTGVGIKKERRGTCTQTESETDLDLSSLSSVDSARAAPCVLTVEVADLHLVAPCTTHEQKNRLLKRKLEDVQLQGN